MDMEEPLTRPAEDAKHAYEVTLTEGDEQETEVILETADKLLEELDNDRHLEFMHASGLEQFKLHLENGYEGTIDLITLIDALRALGPGLVLKIDRGEDHTPPEYVWHNGFGFVGIDGNKLTRDDLWDYPVTRLYHFATTFPVSLYRIQHNEVPFVV